MKKRAMTLGLALFCAFLLCGCQRTTPAAPAQEAAPEPEAAEETVLLLEEPAPVEPEPEPEPEPFAAGEEILLFGGRAPTLTDGDIVLSLKESGFERQDIVAFYYNNKILVKRVIARAGEWVNIDEDGNVTVDGVPLDEPYLTEKALGECDIELPYQVPEGRLFVMGDHRSVSVDSRSKSVGCVAEEQIVGKLVFRIWPFSTFGKL